MGNGQKCQRIKDSNGNRIRVARTNSEMNERRIIIAREQELLPQDEIKAVMKTFEPFYDEHMFKTGHYYKMGSLFVQMDKIAPIGTRILDIGCGTGYLLSHILMQKAREITSPEEFKQRGEKPIKIYGLDFSGKMLLQAYRRMLDRVRKIKEDSRLALEIYTYEANGKKDSKIILKGQINGLAYEDLLVIELLKREASSLNRVFDSESMDTILTTYCYHWFRGNEQKMRIAERTRDLLAPEGVFFSMEEYPLVVTIDEDNSVIKALARSIERATTVIEVSTDLHTLFMDVKMMPIPGTILSEGIDSFHNMYSIALKKCEKTIS